MKVTCLMTSWLPLNAEQCAASPQRAFSEYMTELDLMPNLAHQSTTVMPSVILSQAGTTGTRHAVLLLPGRPHQSCRACALRASRLDKRACSLHKPTPSERYAHGHSLLSLPTRIL